MKKISKDLNYTYIVVAFIIGLSIVGYGYLNYQQKKMVLEEERQTELTKKMEREKDETTRLNKLNLCLMKAETNSRRHWISNCENHGYNIERDEGGEITTCSLRSSLADSIIEEKQKEKDRCTELYKI